MSNPASFQVSGKIVDLRQGKIFPGIISIEDEKIAGIQETEYVDDQFIIPGLIDAHVHVESSMLIPSIPNL